MGSAAAIEPLKILLVAPRYWPHSCDVERFTLRLAEELLRLGECPLVLSCKWSSVWPESIVVREVPVLRLHQAPRGGWSSLRYMTELGRWLRQSRRKFDLVYVLGMRQEAYAAIGALAGTGIPVVVRCHDTGAQGDCAWHAVTRFGDRFRRRCQLAAAIAASGNDARRELLAAGFTAAKIHDLPAGAAPQQGRSADGRFRARSEFADANHDLTVAEYGPLFLWIGRFHELRAFSTLLESWRDIAAHWPSARLWLIGDGPARDPLFRRIIDLELQYQVFLPGTFEDTADLLTAADFLVATDPASMRMAIVDALAAGLTVIASQGTDMDTCITHGGGILVPAADREAWIAAFRRLCDNPPSGVDQKTPGQHAIEQAFSLNTMALKHLELFKRLIVENK